MNNKRTGFCLLSLLGVVLLSWLSVRGEDWTSAGRDSQRQRSTDEKLSTAFTQVWKYPAPAGIISSPAVADGVVVFATRGKYVYGLKESDGSLLWSFLAGDEIYGSPSLANGRVYIPCTDGRIYGLALADGRFIWNYLTRGSEFSSPLVLDNTLILGSGFPNNKVLCLNTLTKQLIWERDIGQIVYSSPAYTDNKIFIGSDNGRYYALERTTGEIIWYYLTGGDVLLSSPLITGNSLFLLPGGTNRNFYRVALNQSDWATNWQLTLTDPNAPVGVIIGTKLATSSPIALSTDRAAFTVRFDYYLDTNADDTADEYVLNEYVVAVDLAGQSLKWQKAFGTRITTDQNKIPALGLCPTPAVMDSADGLLLVVCSSLAPEFRIINPADGMLLASYGLDSACQASPAVANSRVFIASLSGSLYAFQCNTNRLPNPPASGFSPSGNETVISNTPTIFWNPATDPDAADPAGTLRYLIRVDDDGEVLDNYDYVTTTAPGITSFVLPYAVPDNTKIVYAIRTIDDDRAYSGWSGLQSFWVNRSILAPEPPSNLRTVPGNGSVQLFWDASPSPDVQGYLLNWKSQTGDYGAFLPIGNITNYQVDGLTNGMEYTFQLLAKDYDGLISNAITTTARPAYPVMVNDTAYEVLTDAFANADSGDTVRLGVGTFVIPYTLRIKAGVNIQGYSPRHTILNGTGLDRLILLVSGAGLTSTISSLTMFGSQVGIDTAGYQAVIRNTIIRECQIGILVGAGASAEIVNNTIINNLADGLQVNSTTTYIRNNIIMENTCGIRGESVLTPVISYNNVYGNTVNYYQISPGIGNISLYTVFRDEPNKDFRVQIDQPTIDMGDPADDYLNEPHPRGTRINMGAYGNTPYAATSGNFYIATDILPDGETGSYYNVFLATVGGSGPVTWTITAGSLPAGLDLNPSGEIAGNISLGAARLHNFTAKVVDFLGNSETAGYAILVNQHRGNNLHFVTHTLANASVRASYKNIINAAGGFPPYKWEVIDGALPPNITLNSATGELSGTPPYGAEGQYTFTLQVTDADNFNIAQAFILPIDSGTVTGSSGRDGGKQWCFIATAAYGSPLAPAVYTLREFRDKYLLTHQTGRWLVSEYYKISPPLAHYIAQHGWARIITQFLLIPLVLYAWFMVSTGLTGKLFFSLVIILLGIALIRGRRKVGLRV